MGRSPRAEHAVSKQPQALGAGASHLLSMLFGGLCVVAVLSLEAAARPKWRGWGDGVLSPWQPAGKWRARYGALLQPGSGSPKAQPASRPQRPRAAAAAAAAGEKKKKKAAAKAAEAAGKAAEEPAARGGGTAKSSAASGQAAGKGLPWGDPPPLPWPPVLRREDVRRGLSYHGSDGRLQAVAAKLRAGGAIKAVTLGGSVTQGEGASSPQAAYPARFFQFLNATFPHSGHLFINKGVGATSSSIFAICSQRWVPEDVDLVVVEFTVNEAEDEPYSGADRRGYEQLLRRLLRLPGRPAVIQLHHYRWFHMDDDDRIEAGVFYTPPAEAQLQVLSHYYGLPAISVRAAVHPLMRAGIRGFKTDAVFNSLFLPRLKGRLPLGDPSRMLEYFYYDKSHPTDTGHQVLAELLASAVLRAAAEAASPRAAEAASGLAAWQPGSLLEGGGGLPPPMIPGNLDSSTARCSLQEDFEAVVVASSGFSYRPERRGAATPAAQKWAWTASKPGSWAEMEFDSRRGGAAGAGSNSSGAGAGSGSEQDGEEGGGPTAYVVHLRSYSGGMGTAEVSCVSGCTCKRATLDGTWKRQASLQEMLPLRVSQHAACRIRVQVSSAAGETPQEASGHKVSLMGLLVSHLPLRRKTRVDILQRED